MNPSRGQKKFGAAGGRAGERAAPKAGPQKGLQAGPRPTHWGDVADWYDQLVGESGSEYHQQVILPGVLRLLGIKGDKADAKLRVVDLACGQGVLCRTLAAAGCEVTGIDAADPLIAAARRRNEAERLAIRYVTADVTKLIDDAGKLGQGLAANCADAVTIILAIQNITPLSPVWQACRALLKPAGVLLVVMMHPCFRIPRQSDWVWQDGADGQPVQARAIRQYVTSEKIEIQTHPGLAAHGKDSATTPHFHRPLQSYVNTLGNAGLAIDRVEEWLSHKTSQAGPKKAALDRARKEIPMFMALRGRAVEKDKR